MLGEFGYLACPCNVSTVSSKGDFALMAKFFVIAGFGIKKSSVVQGFVHNKELPYVSD